MEQKKVKKIFNFKRLITKPIRLVYGNTRKNLAIFFKIYFEVKYKCVYLHSLSERALRQQEKGCSLKR